MPPFRMIFVLFHAIFEIYENKFLAFKTRVKRFIENVYTTSEFKYPILFPNFFFV